MKRVIIFAVFCVVNLTLRAQVSFQLSQNPGVGVNPSGLAAADVNGDGKLDLLCVNYVDSTLSVLTNDGHGYFSISGTYAVGQNPEGVVVADIYGNGRLAAICANSSGSNLSILTNNGTGAFSIASSPAVGSYPTHPVAADINGDNKLDLICPNASGNSVSVLTNNGAGAFSTSGTYAVGNGPNSVAVADLFHRGKPDIIASLWGGGGGNSLTVLTNNGFGGFVNNQSLTVGRGCLDVIAVDVNQDGWFDLVSVNYSDSTITVLTNNTSGGFGLSGTYATGTGPVQMSSADVNGDGYVDLVVLNREDNTLTVLTNNHFGKFSLAGTFPAGDHPTDLITLDVNGDGKPDLVEANQYGANLSVLTNNSITPNPPIVITAQPANVTVTNNTGASASFSVTATNNLPLTYQWYYSGTNEIGQAGAYAEIISGFVYGVVVTNGGYSYGNIPSVSFTGGGGSGAGGYATVSNAMVIGVIVTNAGTGYASVPTVVLGTPNGFLFGQTNSTLSINNIGVTNAGNYYVVISNSNSSITSFAATLAVAYPPAITVNPTGLVQAIHSSGTLSVAASGTPPLAYQWQFNGTNLPNATNSSYAITSLYTNNAGSYTVWVSSPYGAALSQAATVAMLPDLSDPFTGVVTLWGQDTVLSVGAIGSGVLSYQWFFNGSAITGATGNSYDLGGIQFTNAGLYSVVVSSSYGSITNQAYQVVVNPANIALGTFPGVYITGTPGYNYIIQGSTNLANPNAWVTLTNLTLTAPMQIWFDASSDISQGVTQRKFYRVQSGQ